MATKVMKAYKKGQAFQNKSYVHFILMEFIAQLPRSNFIIQHPKSGDNSIDFGYGKTLLSMYVFKF